MTLPRWLISARKTLESAISAESNRQRWEVATDAQSELEARLGELLAVEAAVKVGRDSGWFDCVWDTHEGLVRRSRHSCRKDLGVQK